MKMGILNALIAMEMADGIVKSVMARGNALIVMGKVVSHVKHAKGRGHVGNVEGEVKYGVQIATAKAFALNAKVRSRSHAQNV